MSEKLESISSKGNKPEVEQQVGETGVDRRETILDLDEDGYVRLDTWVNSFDRLYRKTDRLYYEMARGCGIPETAYWLMYAIFTQGGCMAVKDIPEVAGYSKQTVNSALRKLEEKGLVKTTFCEGSRKAKQVAFTELGEQLTAEQILPANKAERRAFGALTQDEQTELLRLIDKYVEQVENELAIMRGQES